MVLPFSWRNIKTAVSMILESTTPLTTGSTLKKSCSKLGARFICSGIWASTAVASPLGIINARRPRSLMDSDLDIIGLTITNLIKKIISVRISPDTRSGKCENSIDIPR